MAQTLTITNFSGALTRNNFGDINSGLAIFDSSFGYDPFSNPGQLTWMYQPTDISGAVITDCILTAKIWSFDSTARYVYAVGSTGRVYKIDPTNSSSSITPLYDSPSLLTTLVSGSPTFQYGASLEFYNGKLWIGSDSGVTSLTFAGGSETVISGSYVGAVDRVLKEFEGKLYFANGNNIGEIDSTNLVTTSTKLSPALPNGMFVHDLDVSPDGAYLIISASYLYPERIDSPVGGDRGNQYSVDSYLFYWNGSDAGVTTFTSLSSYPATGLNVFLDKTYFQSNDNIGAALFENKKKILTLPGNLAAMPEGTTSTGTFLSWINPEVTGTINSSTGAGSATFASLYYYGQLDTSMPVGLWRLMRQVPTGSNKTWRCPLNMMVNSYSFSDQFVSGWGKHYISVWEDGSPDAFKFYRLVMPPAANTSPILGVYETQAQMFPMKVTAKQIRVYTSTTIAGNGFQLDLMGPDGTVITNGTFTYTYAAGTDVTKLQGGLDRINFNPAAMNTYAIGVRITNTGTTNMTFNKIEIDTMPSGK
jgi:hypothetical protein